MATVKIFPLIGRSAIKENLTQVRLSAKSQQLRDKMRLLRATSHVPQELVHVIDTHLNAISQESGPLRQWIRYELASEQYISVASPEDLLGILLNLRPSTCTLDPASQQLWSDQKLNHIEQELRQGTVSAVIREEVASLARALRDSALVRKRDTGRVNDVLQSMLISNIFFAIVCVSLLVAFQTKQVPANSPWQLLLIGCFGATGALLSAASRFQQSRADHLNVPNERAGVVFRAAVGTIAAVMISLLLQLRVIDLPFLHIATSDGASLAPGALYIFGFLSGFVERRFFRNGEKSPETGKETAPEIRVTDLGTKKEAVIAPCAEDTNPRDKDIRIQLHTQE
jgi:hypothetical protein